jgi:hypothetical protein
LTVTETLELVSFLCYAVFVNWSFWMSRNRFNNLTIPELVGIVIGAIVIATLAIGLQAWLLSLVLSWFGIALEFWKSVVVVILIGMLFGGARSSSN